jgi:hypothetical protein
MLRLMKTSLALFLCSLVLLLSCRKINEATTLGDDLVPEVDNINTFETTFPVETNNVLLNDTAKLIYDDPVALGNITDDPEFGKTNAAVYFQVNPRVYGTYPFTSKENLIIDSVVLSLAYIAGYGDTNSVQTVRVFEVAPTSPFNDTSFYSFNELDLETTGTELGSASFSIRSLRDSFPIIRKDTLRVGNQLRIRLDNALGERFASYVATNGANGAYYNDTIFKTLFRGLAVKADDGNGNGLAYFSLANTDKTQLTVYYKATKNNTIDTAQVDFSHNLRFIRTNIRSKGGQANIIRRQPAGNWAAYLSNGLPQDDKVYVQSTPGTGGYGYVTIPALDTLQNKLIHRAELIVTRIPSIFDNIFPAPRQLFIDKINATNDSAFILDEFIVQTQNGASYNYSSFGGVLQGDNTYRFNLTASVQDVLTGKKRNNRFRIYAPFDTRPYDASTNPVSTPFIQAIPLPAYGRVVLAGGNYADPAMQLRLRVIYSKL